jgi:APA family basic amino acid/polyamine antiporter
VGFSAPIAAAALAYAAYLAAVIPGLPELPVALSLIAILSGLHGMRVELGAGFQNAFTFGKVLLILAFVVGGLLLGEPSRALEPGAVPFGRALLSPGFAVGLVFVSYAYQGWNASFYVAEELREPTRWLPLSLVVGTSLVAALYLGLNAVFLGAVPAGELSGVEAVAHVASVALFGQRAAGVLSVVIAVGLVSTVGAYVMTGPRVLEAMGRRSPALRALGGRGRGRGPVPAIALQGILATGMALYARLDALLAYAGFTLSLVAALAVAGVPVLRWREPDLPRPYRCWGYPVTPWLFVALALWMAGHAAVRHPGVALAAAATVGLGLGLWWVIEGRKAG